SARAVARLYGLEPGRDAAEPIELVPDTLAIDVTGQTCTILWRGHFSADGLDLAELEVVAGIEMPGRELGWPQRAARGRGETPANAPPAGAARDGATTLFSAEEITQRFAAAPAPPDRDPSTQGGHGTTRQGTIRLDASD